MLKNRQEGRKYLRIKDGKLYVGKDLETPYDEIEGTITNFFYKNEEYNGAQLRKLQIVLSDEEDNFQLSVNTESNSYSALVSFLANVDITRPVSLHPMEEVTTKDGTEVKKRTILVSQDGRFAKSYFTKEDTHGLPKWEVVTVGKKKVTDKSAYLEFLEEFVTTKLLPQVNSNVTKTKTAITTEAEEVDEEIADDSLLPWEK